MPEISLQTEPLISPWLAGRDEKSLQMNLLVGMLPERLAPRKGLNNRQAMGQWLSREPLFQRPEG